MPEIQRLPSSVVNKIAAGEVIERPASVVKELLENSVDAGATRIEVSVQQGGLESIRITDNGHGIACEQLLLAVTSHATSKIQRAEDLFQVATLGFRGEALASIAEVSQMVIRSRTADQDTAFEMRINGGKVEDPVPCSADVGTSIEVANLFFNTPVRRKFMRTTQTEMGHVNEAFARIALANPQVHFTLSHNGKQLHDLPPTEKWSVRVSNFFGEDIGDALIPVSGSDGQVSIHGFVVDPSQSRGHNRMQYLFLNGRCIRDRSLQHALSESYRGLLMTGRYPIAFLRLNMPAEMVDVNVHPAKLEVRFQEGGRLYSQLLGTIRNKFLTTDLTARATLDESRSQETATAQNTSQAGAAETLVLSGAAVDTQEKIPWHQERPSFDWTSSPRTTQDVPGPTLPVNMPVPQFEAANDPATAEAQNRSTARALQIHNRYLITESEEGVVVIDQHALHERIIYEQLREKVLEGKLESQQLLVPEPVPLAPAEAASVLEAADVLSKIGITVEDFGGDTVIVSAYPAMLANHNPAEMLRGVVELLMTEHKSPDARDVVDELLHMISCKAAVKAGDQLSDEEITALIEHRQLCQDAHHCPHGRPTALVFSREELDKRFKRI